MRSVTFQTHFSIRRTSALMDHAKLLNSHLRGIWTILPLKSRYKCAETKPSRCRHLLIQQLNRYYSMQMAVMSLGSWTTPPRQSQLEMPTIYCNGDWPRNQTFHSNGLHLTGKRSTLDLLLAKDYSGRDQTGSLETGRSLTGPEIYAITIPEYFWVLFKRKPASMPLR